jgi:hypothetical protein
MRLDFRAPRLAFSFLLTTLGLVVIGITTDVGLPSIALGMLALNLAVNALEPWPKRPQGLRDATVAGVIFGLGVLSLLLLLADPMVGFMFFITSFGLVAMLRFLAVLHGSASST